MYKCKDILYNYVCVRVSMELYTYIQLFTCLSCGFLHVSWNDRCTDSSSTAFGEIYVPWLQLPLVHPDSRPSDESQSTIQILVHLCLWTRRVLDNEQKSPGQDRPFQLAVCVYDWAILNRLNRNCMESILIPPFYFRGKPALSEH